MCSCDSVTELRRLQDHLELHPIVYTACSYCQTPVRASRPRLQLGTLRISLMDARVTVDVLV